MSDSIPHTWKSSTDVQRRSVFARLDDLEGQLASLKQEIANQTMKTTDDLAAALSLLTTFDERMAESQARIDAVLKRLNVADKGG